MRLRIPPLPPPPPWNAFQQLSAPQPPPPHRPFQRRRCCRKFPRRSSGSVSAPPAGPALAPPPGPRLRHQPRRSSKGLGSAPHPADFPSAIPRPSRKDSPQTPVSGAWPLRLPRWTSPMGRFCCGTPPACCTPRADSRRGPLARRYGRLTPWRTGFPSRWAAASRCWENSPFEKPSLTPGN